MLKIEKDNVNKKIFIKGLPLNNIINKFKIKEYKYSNVYSNKTTNLKIFNKTNLFKNKERFKGFKITNYLTWITNQYIIGVSLRKIGRNLTKYKTKARSFKNIVQSGSISKGILIERVLKRKGGINMRKLIVSTK